MARTRRLSETDGARAFSSLCGLCIFLHPHARKRAEKFASVGSINRFVVTPGTDSLSCLLRFPPPLFPNLVGAPGLHGFSIRSRDNEVLIANGYRHECRPNRPQPAVVSFSAAFISLYKYIYIFFCLFGLHRGIRGFYRKRGTFDRDVLTATTRAPTRQNFPDSLRTPLITHSGPFLTFKIISPEMCPYSNVRSISCDVRLILIYRYTLLKFKLCLNK